MDVDSDADLLSSLFQIEATHVEPGDDAAGGSTWQGPSLGEAAEAERAQSAAEARVDARTSGFAGPGHLVAAERRSTAEATRDQAEAIAAVYGEQPSGRLRRSKRAGAAEAVRRATAKTTATSTGQLIDTDTEEGDVSDDSVDTFDPDAAEASDDESDRGEVEAPVCTPGDDEIAELTGVGATTPSLRRGRTGEVEAPVCTPGDDEIEELTDVGATTPSHPRGQVVEALWEGYFYYAIKARRPLGSRKRDTITVQFLDDPELAELPRNHVRKHTPPVEGAYVDVNVSLTSFKWIEATFVEQDGDNYIVDLHRYDTGSPRRSVPLDRLRPSSLCEPSETDRLGGYADAQEVDWPTPLAARIHESGTLHGLGANTGVRQTP